MSEEKKIGGRYRRIIQISDSESDDDIITSSPTIQPLSSTRIFNISRQISHSSKEDENLETCGLSTVIDDSDSHDSGGDLFRSLEDSPDCVDISHKEAVGETITSSAKDSSILNSSNNSSDVIEVTSDSSDEFVDAKTEAVRSVSSSLPSDDIGKVFSTSTPPEDIKEKCDTDYEEDIPLTPEIIGTSKPRRTSYFSTFDLDDLRKSLPAIPKQKSKEEIEPKKALATNEEKIPHEEKVPEQVKQKWKIVSKKSTGTEEVLSTTKEKTPFEEKGPEQVKQKRESETKQSTGNEETPALKLQVAAVDRAKHTFVTTVVDEFKSLQNLESKKLIKEEEIFKKEASFLKLRDSVTDTVTHHSDTTVVDGIKSPRTLKSEISIKEKEILTAKHRLRGINLSSLPDHGVRLQMQISNQENELKKLKNALKLSEQKYGVSDEAVEKSAKEKLREQWRKNFQGANNGRELHESGDHRKISAFKEPKEYVAPTRLLTVDALEQLHKSIETRPAENIFEDDPKGLKSSIQLMAHQKHALAWLLWRERQRPRGGILADDMGLGKTLTMISLILKTHEQQIDCSSDEESDDCIVEEEWMRSKEHKWRKGGTLVVCPASLVSQWENEIHRKCKSDVLKVVVHHGSSRETSARRLSKYDVVITTYSIVLNEAGYVKGKENSENNKAALHRIKWHRIIVDEAHVIRNHKSKTSIAVSDLRGKYRWVLTGTPLQNKELDIYALLKFLRCSPFDQLPIWRHWVDNKNASGLHRLNAIMNAIMLRRTKDQLQGSGSLSCLPEKKEHIVQVKLSEEEFKVYESLLNFSRTLVAQFLHQRAEKVEETTGSSVLPFLRGGNGNNSALNKNSELSAMYKNMKNMQDVKTYQILVLLLRLRQLCCHPGLIKAMLEEDSKEVEGIEDSSGLDCDLLSQMNNLSISEAKSEAEESGQDEKLIEGKILVDSNPVFDFGRCSSKMQVVFDKLSETVLSSNDKAIIISQWTSMLEVIGTHLRGMGVKYTILSGSIPVKERGQIIDNFNRPDHGPKVMLLSLTAGGVGLNLVGANHLFLFDVHWNPQLEAQACDRIYRVGQKKPVHIYKFLCEETIETRIKKMQDTKLALASEVLTGARQKRKDKLSLDDLRVLFGF